MGASDDNEVPAASAGTALADTARTYEVDLATYRRHAYVICGPAMRRLFVLGGGLLLAMVSVLLLPPLSDTVRALHPFGRLLVGGVGMGIGAQLYLAIRLMRTSLFLNLGYTDVIRIAADGSDIVVMSCVGERRRSRVDLPVTHRGTHVVIGGGEEPWAGDLVPADIWVDIVTEAGPVTAADRRSPTSDWIVGTTLADGVKDVVHRASAFWARPFVVAGLLLGAMFTSSAADDDVFSLVLGFACAIWILGMIEQVTVRVASPARGTDVRLDDDGAVVTSPGFSEQFPWDATRRCAVAERTVHVDELIIVPRAGELDAAALPAGLLDRAEAVRSPERRRASLLWLSAATVAAGTTGSIRLAGGILDGDTAVTAVLTGLLFGAIAGAILNGVWIVATAPTAVAGVRRGRLRKPRPRIRLALLGSALAMAAPFAIAIPTLSIGAVLVTGRGATDLLAITTLLVGAATLVFGLMRPVGTQPAGVVLAGGALATSAVAAGLGVIQVAMGSSGVPNSGLALIGAGCCAVGYFGVALALRRWNEPGLPQGVHGLMVGAAVIAGVAVGLVTGTDPIDSTDPDRIVADPVVAATPVGNGTFREAWDSAARFDVRWLGDRAVLDPTTDAARLAFSDDVGERRQEVLEGILSSVAGLVGQRPSIERLVIAEDRDAAVAVVALRDIGGRRARTAERAAQAVRQATGQTDERVSRYLPQFDLVLIDHHRGSDLLDALALPPGSKLDASQSAGVMVLLHEIEHAVAPLEHVPRWLSEATAEVLPRWSGTAAGVLRTEGLSGTSAGYAGAEDYEEWRGLLEASLRACGMDPARRSDFNDAALLLRGRGTDVIPNLAECMLSEGRRDPLYDDLVEALHDAGEYAKAAAIVREVAAGQR